MRVTTAVEKFLSSFINVIYVFLCCLPFFFVLDISLLSKKLLFIAMFFLYKLLVIFFNKNRSLGMVITQTGWKKIYPVQQQVLHAILYSLSFSTLLFWFFFPFDLFLLNMLFQFLMVRATGTTVHGYFSGRMFSVKN